MGSPWHKQPSTGRTHDRGQQGGKTTTAGKLAAQLKNDGKKSSSPPQIHSGPRRSDSSRRGERTGVRVIARSGRSSAVVFDAIMAAKAGNYDVVIADTGRLHTKST